MILPCNTKQLIFKKKGVCLYVLLRGELWNTWCMYVVLTQRDSEEKHTHVLGKLLVDTVNLVCLWLIRWVCWG